MLRLGVFVAAAFTAAGITSASAICDPTAILVQDYTHVTWTEQMKISFLLTATKEQYESVRQSWNAAGGYGLFYGSLDYDSAKSAALRESQYRKYDYSRQDYLDYTFQHLSDNSVQAYEKCLENDPNRPQMSLWVASRRVGLYYTIDAFWVGGNEVKGDGKEQEFKVVGAELIQKPSIWPKAKTQAIFVQKKDVNAPAIVSLNVSDQSSAIFLLPDAPEPKPYVVSSTHRIGITSGGSDKNDGWCQRRTNSDCITPQHGGYFEGGSVHLNSISSSGGTRTGWTVLRDRPEEVCLEVWAQTGACEVEIGISGVVTATERAVPAAAGVASFTPIPTEHISSFITPDRTEGLSVKPTLDFPTQSAAK
jgi:hypothetical protein